MKKIWSKSERRKRPARSSVRFRLSEAAPHFPWRGKDELTQKSLPLGGKGTNSRSFPFCSFPFEGKGDRRRMAAVEEVNAGDRRRMAAVEGVVECPH